MKILDLCAPPGRKSASCQFPRLDIFSWDGAGRRNVTVVIGLSKRSGCRGVVVNGSYSISCRADFLPLCRKFRYRGKVALRNLNKIHKRQGSCSKYGTLTTISSEE